MRKLDGSLTPLEKKVIDKHFEDPSKSWSKIAEEVGCHKQTVYTMRYRPEFQRAVQQHHEENVKIGKQSVSMIKRSMKVLDNLVKDIESQGIKDGKQMAGYAQLHRILLDTAKVVKEQELEKDDTDAEDRVALDELFDDFRGFYHLGAKTNGNEAILEYVLNTYEQLGTFVPLSEEDFDNVTKEYERSQTVDNKDFTDCDVVNDSDEADDGGEEVIEINPKE